MQRHALDPKVFIRSMGARGHLGGLSLATREAIRLLGAFGFDQVILETVGVGQSELEVAAVAGTTVVVLLLPATGWADAVTPESGGSPNADAIDSLYKVVFFVALAVFLAVEGTLAYSLVAHRARRGRVAAQTRGNTRLEIGWTLAAALILVAITIVTFGFCNMLATSGRSRMSCR